MSIATAKCWRVNYSICDLPVANSSDDVDNNKTQKLQTCNTIIVVEGETLNFKCYIIETY